MAVVEGKEYTKISIRKDLHTLVKQICDKEGLKMYHFEDEAIKEYIRANWQKYIQNGDAKIVIEEE